MTLRHPVVFKRNLENCGVLTEEPYNLNEPYEHFKRALHLL